jgi:acetoacetyl-CoA synthetase
MYFFIKITDYLNYFIFLGYPDIKIQCCRFIRMIWSFEGGMLMVSVAEGALLWEPSPEFQKQSNMYRYMEWLRHKKGLSFSTYNDLWQWSVDYLEDFWASVWDFFEVKVSKPYGQVLVDRRMPGAKWFTGAHLNYAEHLLRFAQKNHPAIVAKSELRPLHQLTWEELIQQVGALAATLRRLGVRPGDRVVAYMPNIPETIVAFLATTTLGAIWSSCAPEFGTPSVVNRFKQIEPKVLLAVDGYVYQGKAYDRMDVIAQLQAALPTVEQIILVPYLQQEPDLRGLRRVCLWADALQSAAELVFEPVSFDHPLWVLYSSGTTGLPKPIVQSHGGCLLAHLVVQALHSDLKPGDRFFWFTTTGWMMWNIVVSSLLTGATAVLYDGSPAYPDLMSLWKFAEEAKLTVFGASAGFITSCMKAGLNPGRQFDLSHLKVVAYTGSPLSPDGFKWVYDAVRSDVWLAPASGGTDVCASLVCSSPLSPVYAGEIPCRALGAKVESFDPEGRPQIGEVGELVVTEPMPSMPLFFWNDPDGKRYHQSYFETYPDVWCHGDLIKITERGSAIIYGRSDATINRMGVRIGTGEIYSVVEALPEVEDALLVDTTALGQQSFMPLFVVLKPGVEMTDELKESIRRAIRENVSPRHVPDEVYAVREIPRTLNGKKMEVPVRKLLMGTPLEKAVSLDAMSNPSSMQWFVRLAGELQAGRIDNA